MIRDLLEKSLVGRTRERKEKEDGTSSTGAGMVGGCFGGEDFRK